MNAPYFGVAKAFQREIVNAVGHHLAFPVCIRHDVNHALVGWITGFNRHVAAHQNWPFAA